jgi:uroporphyrinogen decarboxylase
MAQSIEELRGMARLGVQGAWIIETRASADLISPKHFDEFALPYLRTLVTEVKALGMATILYFCGDAMPRLTVLRNLGVDAIALEESKKTFKIDIEEVVDRVGDVLTVFGNVDAIGIMDHGTPEMIEDEVKRQIRAGKKARGFVAGIGSPLTPTTSPRNLDLFVRAVRRHGML